jgi:hypothetical protein
MSSLDAACLDILRQLLGKVIILVTGNNFLEKGVVSGDVQGCSDGLSLWGRGPCVG